MKEQQGSELHSLTKRFRSIWARAYGAEDVDNDWYDDFDKLISELENCVVFPKKDLKEILRIGSVDRGFWDKFVIGEHHYAYQVASIKTFIESLLSGKLGLNTPNKTGAVPEKKKGFKSIPVNYSMEDKKETKKK